LLTRPDGVLASVALIALACLWASSAFAETVPGAPPNSQETAAGGGTERQASDGADPAAGGQAGPIRANLPELEDEVMCPICGTLLGMSRAPAAERQRAFMRKLIREGKTNEEIKDALVVEYGPQVLGLPDDDEINFFVYLVPLIGLILASLGVFWAAIRWRRGRRPDGPGTSSGPAPAGRPSNADSDRLDRDMAEHEL
jgi:cytochrome c-type biogenesis protein CcmH